MCHTCLLSWWFITLTSFKAVFHSLEEWADYTKEAHCLYLRGHNTGGVMIEIKTAGNFTFDPGVLESFDPRCVAEFSLLLDAERCLWLYWFTKPHWFLDKVKIFWELFFKRKCFLFVWSTLEISWWWIQDEINSVRGGCVFNEWELGLGLNSFTVNTHLLLQCLWAAYLFLPELDCVVMDRTE